MLCALVLGSQPSVDFDVRGGGSAAARARPGLDREQIGEWGFSGSFCCAVGLAGPMIFLFLFFLAFWLLAFFSGPWVLSIQHANEELAPPVFFSLASQLRLTGFFPFRCSSGRASGSAAPRKGRLRMCAGLRPSPHLHSVSPPPRISHGICLSYLGCSLFWAPARLVMAWRLVQPAFGAQCVGQDVGEEACTSGCMSRDRQTDTGCAKLRCAGLG